MIRKPEGKKVLLLEIAILVILPIVCIILAIHIRTLLKTGNDGELMKSTKLVLYEGPKSLKDTEKEDLKTTSENLRDISLMHCVDTQVKINGQDCYVYDTNVNHSRQWSNNYSPSLSRTPVTYFDFDGKVKIEVTVPEIDLEQVKISPVSYGLKPDINKQTHTLTFYISDPDTYTVTFNDSPKRALHIFAQSIEEAPDLTDENVVYIGPGEWNIDNIVLKDNEILYISGGAVVHGCVSGNFVKNVTVCGHGIIDGSKVAGWQGTNPQIPLKFDNCENITIKDVMVLNANAWVFQSYDTKKGLVEGLKIISPRPNGDGISLQSCEDFMVKDCFVRTWDDSLVVKNYDTNSKNIEFDHIQIWTDFAQSMEVGYETNKGKKENASISDITFKNILVLNNFHKPVISVHNADDAVVSDITFQNITVENAQMGCGDGAEMPYLIDLDITQNTNWSSTRERGQIRDITIDNVNVLAGKFSPSRIKGYDETHKVENVTITNLTILGKKINDFETGQFEIDSKTTSNLTLK